METEVQIENPKTERGKRKAARWLLGVWTGVTITTFAVVGYGSLEIHELETLVALYRTATTFTGLLVLGLFGLDATGVEIIPAIKGKIT